MYVLFGSYNYLLINYIYDSFGFEYFDTSNSHPHNHYYSILIHYMIVMV
nr:MAG TPA: hypothetical protein [Caudoviricetes sp.]